MKAFIYTILFFALLLTSQFALAQTTIAIQDFEVAPATPTMPFTITAGTGAFSTGNGLFPVSPKFVSGSRGYQISNSNTTITFDVVNTASFMNIALNFRLASFSVTSGNGSEATDNVIVEISTDGGTTWSNELQVNGNTNARWSFVSGTGTGSTPYDGNNTPTIFAPAAGGNRTTDGFSNIIVSGLPSSTTLRVRLIIDNNDGNELWVIDDVELEGDPIVACPQTITSFAPTSGPIGSEITITGTNFTAGSTVSFNGIAASSVVFVNSTTLIATVPALATTGLITVTEAGCNINSAANFTLIAQSGTCGTIFSDIVFSEIYDNTAGSLGYIELYNGTGATVDLTLYRIDRFGNIADIAPTHSYTFPAGTTIAHGQVLVGKVSTDANVGGVVPNFTFPVAVAGYNDNDRLELVRIASAVVVDDFHDAVVGALGYVYRRNTTITGPNPAFAAGEWTTAAAGTTANLGIFAVPAAALPVINTQPVDVTSCPFTLSVTATAGGGGALTYQWKYNDGLAAGWSNVTAAAFTPITVAGATSATLSLGGDLNAIAAYQFYCEVIENGTCTKATEAAQFDYAGRFYRSAATGNWSNPANWQSATSAAGPWTAACTYPTFSNSDYIHVLNTHTISADLSLTVDEVVIETGGTLSINSDRLLTFNNGTGIDLQVIGTLIDNGNGGFGSNFSTNSANWILDANGEIIKTSGSSIAQYRDNYSGGISTIPATATWRFRYIGSSLVPIITVGMFYPNLYFESTNGNHTFGAATEMFNGAGGGFATVKGNFYVGNTGTGAVEVFNLNTNVSPMQILGDMIIGGNASGTTSKFENNNNGTTVGTGLEIFGNLTIHTNGLLDFDEGTAATDGVVRLYGDWTDLNTGIGFAQGQSTVSFIGSSTQTVSKATGNENFHNVVVNKPAGNLQNNANNMVVKNNMTFTNGIVLTSAAAYLVFEPFATATTASNASHTDGPVIKQTDNVVQTNFTYPTGDNGIYGAIGIQTRFQNGESFVAEYFNVGYGIYNVNTAELTDVSHIEYWLLDDLGGLGENLYVTLHWGPHSGVTTPADTRVAHYFTEAPSVVNQWEREGASPIITGTATSGTVTSTYVTSFSPFTISVDPAILPLNLLFFEAEKVNRTAELYWQVANEKAGDQYCIQRSADAQNFETLACFDATQDNALAAYNYTDASPLVGYNYYRIHQIDAAGDHNYSYTRVLEFEGNSDILVYPSPANNELVIELEPIKEGSYTVKIIDELGRILIEKTIAKGVSIYQLELSTLAAGGYVLQVVGTNGVSKTKKISVVR